MWLCPVDLSVDPEADWFYLKFPMSWSWIRDWSRIWPRVKTAIPSIEFLAYSSGVFDLAFSFWPVRRQKVLLNNPTRQCFDYSFQRIVLGETDAGGGSRKCSLRHHEGLHRLERSYHSKEGQKRWVLRHIVVERDLTCSTYCSLERSISIIVVMLVSSRTYCWPWSLPAIVFLVFLHHLYDDQ